MTKTDCEDVVNRIKFHAFNYLATLTQTKLAGGTEKAPFALQGLEEAVNAAFDLFGHKIGVTLIVKALNEAKSDLVDLRFGGIMLDLSRTWSKNHEQVKG